MSSSTRVHYRYDLCGDKGDAQIHLEVKGTQGEDVCFIVTAAEVRNAMIDRKHIPCVVTAALTDTPKMFTYAKDEFLKKVISVSWFGPSSEVNFGPPGSL